MANVGPADGGGSNTDKPLFPIDEVTEPVGKEGAGKTTLETDPVPKWRPKGEGFVDGRTGPERRIHASDVAREQAQCDTQKDDKATETRRTIVCDCSIVLNWDTHAAQLFLCHLHSAASDMLTALEVWHGLFADQEERAMQGSKYRDAWAKTTAAIAAAKKAPN